MSASDTRWVDPAAITRRNPTMSDNGWPAGFTEAHYNEAEALVIQAMADYGEHLSQTGSRPYKAHLDAHAFYDEVRRVAAGLHAAERDAHLARLWEAASTEQQQGR